MDTRDFPTYLMSLIKSIPAAIAVCDFILIIIGVVVILSMKGLRKRLSYISLLIAIGYFVLILSSTVFGRDPADGYSFNIKPFWSYSAYLEGHVILFPESIMNVVIFIPLGFLTSIIFHPSKIWKVILTGMAMSMSIEFLQLVFRRGLCEIDDVIHNTIGAILGFYIFQLVICILRKSKHTYYILER